MNPPDAGVSLNWHEVIFFIKKIIFHYYSLRQTKYQKKKYIELEDFPDMDWKNHSQKYPGMCK